MSGSQDLLSMGALVFLDHTYDSACIALGDYIYSVGFILIAQLLDRQLRKLWVYV